MATPSRDYRYSVEFNIHAVDAPGTRLIKKGDIYINICLLGTHQRTRLMPPYLPMHIDQKFYFDKVFKFCYDPDDIISRLEREHVLIELIQNDFPSPILLARFETTAKDFLYPYSSIYIEYIGLRRYVLLSRTIDFPGISPSFEFSTSPSVVDVTGLTLSATKTFKETKTLRRSRSPTWRPSSSFAIRSRLNDLRNLSRSAVSHTISSAIKNDYGQRDTQEKLRELAVDRDIHYVTPTDKTQGRPPFVVRHVTNDLIGRKPESHITLSDGLVINSYTLARPEITSSLHSFDNSLNRSRSISPSFRRSFSSVGRERTRSLSPSRRSLKLSQSSDFEIRGRSFSPSQYLYNNDDYYTGSYDTYSGSSPRRSMSPTLHRDSFRYRYRYSPAADLSDKVIHTLRRNLSSYSTRLRPPYYSSFRYSDEHIDDDVLERSRRPIYD